MMNTWDMFVIYNKPLDHPQSVVCRRWEIGPAFAKPKELIVVKDTIDDCRNELFEKYPNLTKLPVSDMDDPNIAEVYG